MRPVKNKAHWWKNGSLIHVTMIAGDTVIRWLADHGLTDLTTRWPRDLLTMWLADHMSPWPYNSLVPWLADLTTRWPHDSLTTRLSWLHDLLTMRIGDNVICWPHELLIRQDTYQRTHWPRNSLITHMAVHTTCWSRDSLTMAFTKLATSKATHWPWGLRNFEYQTQFTDHATTECTTPMIRVTHGS